MTIISPGHTVCVYVDDMHVLQMLENQKVRRWSNFWDMRYRRPKIRKHEGGVSSKVSVVDVRELEITKLVTSNKYVINLEKQKKSEIT